MIHHHTTLEPSDHYAICTRADGALLAQLQHIWSSGTGNQVRVMRTPEKAQQFAHVLTAAADLAVPAQASTTLYA